MNAAYENEIDRLGTDPTWSNQIAYAERLYVEEGKEGLERHARVGRQCGCGKCFCCAAQLVYRRRVLRQYANY